MLIHAVCKFEICQEDTSTDYGDDDTDITVVTKTVIRFTLYSKCVAECGPIRGEVAGARDMAQPRGLLSSEKKEARN
jgi:hypothetical protein